MTSLNTNHSQIQPKTKNNAYDPRLAGSVKFTSTNPTTTFFSMLNQAIHQNKEQTVKNTVMGLNDKPGKEKPSKDKPSQEKVQESDTDLRAENVKTKLHKEKIEAEKNPQQDKNVNEKNSHDTDEQNAEGSETSETEESVETLSKENLSEETSNVAKKTSEKALNATDILQASTDDVMPRLPEPPGLGSAVQVNLNQIENQPNEIVQQQGSEILKGLPVQQALLVSEMNAKEQSITALNSVTSLTKSVSLSQKNELSSLVTNTGLENATSLKQEDLASFDNIIQDPVVSKLGLPVLKENNAQFALSGLPAEVIKPEASLQTDILSQPTSTLLKEATPQKNIILPDTAIQSVLNQPRLNEPRLNEQTPSTTDPTPSNLFISQLNTQGELKALNPKMMETDSLKIKAGEGILSKIADINPQAVQVSVNLGQTQTQSNAGGFSHQPQFSDFDSFESDAVIGSVEGAKDPNRLPLEFSLQGPAEGGFNDLGQSAKVKVAGQTPTDQVVNATKMAINNGQKEMSLQLNPDNMGQVKINLVSTANGQVHARLITSSQETQQELNAKVDQLRASLEKQGVNVGQITVIAAGETGTGNQNTNQSNQQSQADLFRQPESSSNPDQQGQAGQSQAQHNSQSMANSTSNAMRNDSRGISHLESQNVEAPTQDLGNIRQDGSRVSVLI